jgi:hypothetical protein
MTIIEIITVTPSLTKVNFILRKKAPGGDFRGLTMKMS